MGIALSAARAAWRSGHLAGGEVVVVGGAGGVREAFCRQRELFGGEDKVGEVGGGGELRRCRTPSGSGSPWGQSRASRAPGTAGRDR